MRTRRLGSNGPELTIIGFGCWAMGGEEWEFGWGPQDDDASVMAIHTALDSGVNWFDTAAVYGLGHSEEVLAKALGSTRRDVIVATKCGLVWDENRKITKNGQYQSIIREADASLRRLNTDYIDLYQMHWPDVDSNAPVDDTMRAMQDLVKAGKVRFIGVSNFDKPLLLEAGAVCHIDSLQPPFNMLERSVEDEVLPYCFENGIGVVAYSPLASGLLSGHYDSTRTFDATDWRSRDERFTDDGLHKNLKIVDRLRAIAVRFDKTVAQLALAWVLSHQEITSAIVGVRKVSHVTDALPGADWILDAETLHDIENVIAKQPLQAR